MNIYMFQNTNPEFARELEKAIKSEQISKTINIVYGETPIQSGPYIKTSNRQVYLDETFLSYLWCISHSLYTIYIQEIDYPKCNSIAGFNKYEIDKMTP